MQIDQEPNTLFLYIKNAAEIDSEVMFLLFNSAMTDMNPSVNDHGSLLNLLAHRRAKENIIVDLDSFKFIIEKCHEISDDIISSEKYAINEICSNPKFD